MRVLKRSDADLQLRQLGVTQERIYNSGSYELSPQQDELPLIIIDEFIASEKPRLLNTVVQGLIQIRPLWWLVPKFTYFGETPWSVAQWASVNLPTITDEVIEWSQEELNTISPILNCHAESGWNVGWDLFLVSADGTLLMFLDHHEIITVRSRDRGDLVMLSKHLSGATILHELYP